MANTFKLFIEQGGAYKKVRAVFPFTSGELLDERLDESKVVFFSRVKDYNPLTEFKVEFNENGTVSEEYYILANDNSAEYPAGSGVYRHEAYLIERTKLLEGVVCPSLTFTNALPRDYSKVRSTVYFGAFAYPGITSPRGTNENIEIPGVNNLGISYIEFKNDDVGTNFYEYQTSYNNQISSLTVKLNGIVLADKTTTDIIINKQDLMVGKLELEYTVISTFVDDDNNTLVYPFYPKFEIALVENKVPLAPWTITECINRVLECAEPVFVGPDGASQIFRFKLDGVSYEYDSNGSLISDPNKYSGTALKYKNVLAPEFSMTQSTLREQLKVIGSFIHAEPYIVDKDVTGAYIFRFIKPVVFVV